MLAVLLFLLSLKIVKRCELLVRGEILVLILFAGRLMLIPGDAIT